MNIASCNNYYCEGYKENKCVRAIEHKRKLNKKALDDNHITKRNNIRLCELFIAI